MFIKTIDSIIETSIKSAFNKLKNHCSLSPHPTHTQTDKHKEIGNVKWKVCANFATFGNHNKIFMFSEKKDDSS